MFTGLRINYKKELSLAFGDYAEVYDGTDNTVKSRSVPCIALYPCNNSTGCWVFLNLQTKRQVRRSQWQKMVMTKLVIEQMNAYDPEAATPTIEAVQPTASETTEVVTATADNRRLRM